MKPLFFVIIFCSIALSVNAQGVRSVALRQEHVAYTPGSYYISNVVDDRADKTSIGSLNSGSTIGKLNLQNGAAEAIKGFIDRNVTQNKTTQAIVMHITRLNFDIKKSGGQWRANGDVAFTFYAGDRKLIELSGKGEKEMDNNPVDFIDEFIKKALGNDLKKFDSWWVQNHDRIPTAATVKVIPVIGKTVSKPGCIVYSLNRPLNIADFQGPPEDNIVELAATLSGVGMESSGATQNGQLVLTVTLTPYFSKSGSWFKAEGKSPGVLAHEQTHFDITAIKVCELITKISNTTFTRENYEKKIEELMTQNSEETNKEEALFDTETNHGIIHEKEAEWEKKVKDRIRVLGCY